MNDFDQLFSNGNYIIHTNFQRGNDKDIVKANS